MGFMEYESRVLQRVLLLLGVESRMIGREANHLIVADNLNVSIDTTLKQLNHLVHNTNFLIT